MKVRTIIDEVHADLLDSGHDVWSELEMLSYLNDAQLEIISQRPDSFSTTASVELTVGVTKQTIPDAARRLIDRGITRNMGEDGNTPGDVIDQIARESMDQLDPGWHSKLGKTVIEAFIYSEADPKTFYVTPPAHATTAVWVELIYSGTPPELLIAGIETDEIALDDVYKPAIKEFMYYRAYSKETDSNESRSLAAGHFQVFGNLLGLKFKIDRMYSASMEEKT